MTQLKTENQIYKDIIGFINSSLSALDITGWKVMQLKQPVKLTEINPTIYVTCTNRNRRGWQQRLYPVVNQELKIKEGFIQEIDVQISALRRRELTDTADTFNSSDVLENIKTYMLNPYSLQDLRALGYTIYQPSNIQSPDFFDDSDNFEFMPFFNVTFILNQSLIRPQTSIDKYTLKVREV
ncbi:MAG: hypothetical protein II244_02820 [Clostridia bacterium]|nr:hypothetical protein [Clostridia bacterium]